MVSGALAIKQTGRVLQGHGCGWGACVIAELTRHNCRPRQDARHFDSLLMQMSENLGDGMSVTTLSGAVVAVRFKGSRRGQRPSRMQRVSCSMVMLALERK